MRLCPLAPCLCALALIACTAPNDVPCSACTANQVCVDGACMNLPSSCPCPKSSYCDIGSNSCKLGCLQDTDCNTGQVCTTATRACVTGCRKDSDCTGAGETCEVASGMCRAHLGSGTFFPARTFTTGATGLSPYAAIAADFNRDGKLDVATANNGSGNVSILLGDGGGNLGTAQSVNVGTGPYALAAGELNGDGAVDLVVVNSTSGEVSVLLGNGSGGFSSGTPVPTGATMPSHVVLADWSGDGKLDMGVGFLGTGTTFMTWRGNGAGGFTNAATVPAGGTSPRYLAASDVDGDMKLDLVVANTGSNSVSVLLGDGMSGFGPAITATTGTAPRFLALGDFNGDGRLDVAAASNTVNNVFVLYGSGGGRLMAGTTLTPVGYAGGVVAGYLNADGRIDLATTNSSTNDISVFANGTTGFGLPAATPVGMGPRGPVIADFNNDNKPDLLIANSTGNSVSLLINQ